LVLLDADRFEEAAEVLRTGQRLAEERGSVLWLPLYHWALGMVSIFDGALDQVDLQIRTGLDMANAVGTRLHAGFLYGALAFVAIRRDQLAEAQVWLDEARSEVVAAAQDTWRSMAESDLVAAGPLWPVEWGMWVAGLLYEARGETKEAAALLAQAWELSAPLRGFLGYRFFGPDLVRLSLRAGDLKRAITTTEEVEALAARSTVASAEGAALRCRGLVEADVDLLVRAVDAYRKGPRLGDLASACEEAGLALTGAGRTGEGIALLEEALAVHERAGATRDIARTSAVLAGVR